MNDKRETWAKPQIITPDLSLINMLLVGKKKYSVMVLLTNFFSLFLFFLFPFLFFFFPPPPAISPFPFSSSILICWASHEVRVYLKYLIQFFTLIMYCSLFSALSISWASLLCCLLQNVIYLMGSPSLPPTKAPPAPCHTLWVSAVSRIIRVHNCRSPVLQAWLSTPSGKLGLSSQALAWPGLARVPSSTAVLWALWAPLLLWGYLMKPWTQPSLCYFSSYLIQPFMLVAVSLLDVGGHLWGANWFPSVIPYLFSFPSPPEACSEPKAMAAAAAHAGRILLLLFLPWQQLFIQLVKWLRTSQGPSVSLCLNPLMQFDSTFRTISLAQLTFFSVCLCHLWQDLFPWVGIFTSHLLIWLASFSDINCLASSKLLLLSFPSILEGVTFITSLLLSSFFGTKRCGFNILRSSHLPSHFSCP